MRNAHLILLAFLTFAALPAQADEGKAAPRFGTLRSDKVNIRTGPGTDYPIEWIFVRKGLPVEIVANFDTWRKIRDQEGTEGWVHQSMLAGRRSVLIAGKPRALHHSANPSAPVVATVEPGVIARLLRCEPVWCEVKVDGYRGWITHDEVWGVTPGEVTQ